MVEKVIDSYGAFGDATIDQLTYQMIPKKLLSVYISCLNWKTNKWEQIELTFTGVTQIRFVEPAKFTNAVIFEALLERKEEEVLVDFFHIQVDGTLLAEDPDSHFSVHTKGFSYQVLKQYQ